MKRSTILIILSVLISPSSATPILGIEEPISLGLKVCQKDAVKAFDCELFMFKGHQYLVGYLKETRKVFHVEEVFPDGSSKIRYRTAYVHETKA